MTIWIVWSIPEDSYYENTIKAFDSEEKAKTFIKDHTSAENPEPTYFYAANGLDIQDNESIEISAYYYEEIEVE